MMDCARIAAHKFGAKFFILFILKKDVAFCKDA